MRVGGAAVLVALGLALAACGGDDDGDAVPVTTTTADAGDATTTTTGSTAATATTTFAQADTPPPLVNTGEDFDAIVRSFVAYGEWLSVHPDVERLDDYVRRDSQAWRELEPAFAELIDQGWRTAGETPGVVHETRVLERPGPNLAIVYLAIESPSFRIVDAAGRAVRDVPAEPTTGWAYELRREEGGPWLLESRTVLGEL